MQALAQGRAGRRSSAAARGAPGPCRQQPNDPTHVANACISNTICSSHSAGCTVYYNNVKQHTLFAACHHQVLSNKTPLRKSHLQCHCHQDDSAETSARLLVVPWAT